MMRSMLHFTRGEFEPIDLFMQRTNGTIKKLIALHNVEPWDLKSHRYIFNWAGWLARVRDLDPTRLTGWFFIYKDYRWIQKIARGNAGRQLHCRRLRTWRWERPLYNLVGEEWPNVARTKEVWEDMIGGLVHKRAAC